MHPLTSFHISNGFNTRGMLEKQFISKKLYRVRFIPILEYKINYICFSESKIHEQYVMHIRKLRMAINFHKENIHISGKLTYIFTYWPQKYIH